MTRFIAADIESTGTDPATDKIVEVGMILADTDGSIIDQYEIRLNPERSIPADATRVHGITYSDVAACQKFVDVADDIARFMAQGEFLLGHNIAFDKSMFEAEFRAAKRPFPVLPIACTMEQGRWATPDGKSPKLREVAFALGLDFDESKAHGALYDIERTVACFLSGYARGFYRVPDALRARMKPTIKEAA